MPEKASLQQLPQWPFEKWTGSVWLLQLRRFGVELLVVFGSQLFGDGAAESLLEESAGLSAGGARETVCCQSDFARG